MRPDTWATIAREILKMLYDRQKQNQMACDKDFKRIAKRHARSYVYDVRNSLIKKGIIKRTGRKYYLAYGNFRPRGEILKYVSFLRSRDRTHMKIGALSLREIYSEDTISKERDFEEFLQAVDLNMLLESEDVVEASEVKEVWMLFVDILNDIEEFSWISRVLAEAMYGAVIRMKLCGFKDLLETSVNHKALKDELSKSLQNAIFCITRSEALYCMYDSVAIKLLRILQELNDESECLLNTIKELLRTPSPNRNRFSRMERPASDDDLCPSYETKFPELWYTTGDYSNLFKAIYMILRKMGKERMRNLLLKWMDDEDVNLRLGASTFLDCLLKRDSEVSECFKNAI